MPHIVASGTLAVLLFLASFFFMSSYHQYTGCRERIETLKVRGRVLKHQISDMQQKKKTVLLVNSFVEKAVALGLDDKNWSAFHVNIQEPLTFY